MLLSPGAPDYATNMSGVEARELTCIRGGRSLFAPIGFACPAGGSLLLLGENGAGKSSLLRLIAGLLPLRQGELAVMGRVSLCDENLALDMHHSLRDALSFWRVMDGAEQAALDGALAALSLSHLADVPVRMLSTGQRKRAMLARVLASGAEIWLLDEPGNGLDQTSLGQLGAAMDRHVAGGGIVIAASHFPLPFRFTQTITLSAPPLPVGEDDW